jgi:hypothetical protein
MEYMMNGILEKKQLRRVEKPEIQNSMIKVVLKKLENVESANQFEAY